MKFHDCRLMWKYWANQLKIKGGAQEATEKIIKDFTKTLYPKNRQLYANSVAALAGQLDWIKNSRPYYDLYPSVIEAFAKVDLDKITTDMVKLPLPGIMIRLPIGHEYKTIKSILVTESITKLNTRFWIIYVDDAGSTPAQTSISMYPPESTIMEHIKYGREHPYCDDKDVSVETQEIATKIVTTICLIKGNPDIIEPEPLEADRAEWLRTHDENFLKIAAKKGKRAWSIGKNIQVAPGFRRPHFGIRWMGHGVNKDPVLRPIKGCLVMRQKLTEIPTGWLGEDDGQGIKEESRT